MMPIYFRIGVISCSPIRAPVGRVRRLLGGALLRLARQAGWERDKDLASWLGNVEPIESLGGYDIANPKEVLNLAKRLNPDRSLYEHCRIWVSDDGRSILFVYRFDSR
jgi:hypothetical protein